MIITSNRIFVQSTASVLEIKRHRGGFTAAGDGFS
jgi:hypothetical protein